MEIQFQQPQKSAIPVNKASNKFKSKSRSSSNINNNNKYVGVRQRPSGRWVAEIKDTTQKIRMWLGTFETAEEAARAYDEAACLLRGSKTRTNFVTHHVSLNSPLASRIKNILDKRKKAIQNDQDSSASNGEEDESNSIVDSVNSCDTANMSSTLLFNDDYKPDMMRFSGELENKRSSTVSFSWGLEQSFGRFPTIPIQEHHNQLLELTKDVGNMPGPENLEEFSEFERMRVERQISASLYAITGVQEYMEAVHEDDPIETLRDLPPLCSLLC